MKRCSDLFGERLRVRSQSPQCQFSLRTLLVGCLTVAIVVAIVSEDLRQQQQAKDRIERLGGFIVEDVEQTSWIPRIRRPGLFVDVADTKFSDDDIAILAHLGGDLLVVDVTNSGITDTGYDELERRYPQTWIIRRE